MSLSAGSGKTTVVLGESRSGKSPILHLLVGLLHPDRGEIVVDDVTYADTTKRLVVPLIPVGRGAQGSIRVTMLIDALALPLTEEVTSASVRHLDLQEGLSLILRSKPWKHKPTPDELTRGEKVSSI